MRRVRAEESQATRITTKYSMCRGRQEDLCIIEGVKTKRAPIFAARAFCFNSTRKLFPNAATAVRSFGQSHRHGHVPSVADNFDVHGVANLAFVEKAKEIVVILYLLA